MHVVLQTKMCMHISRHNVIDFWSWNLFEPVLEKSWNFFCFLSTNPDDIQSGILRDSAQISCVDIGVQCLIFVTDLRRCNLIFRPRVTIEKVAKSRTQLFAKTHCSNQL
jgi:hypothetical protein